MFTEKMLGEIITKCQEAWKEEPKHFLDLEKEYLKTHKERYEEDVQRVREQFADIVENYNYLKPVFASINKDVVQ